MFSVGDLVAVNASSRPELNSRIWKVTDFKEGRVVLASADGLCDDVGAVKHIAVKEDKITHLALMPSPRTLTEETDLFARFVFGSGGGGSSREPRLNTWRSLPLLGGNMICLTKNSDEHYELVMYPQLRGYQLHFYSAWAEVTITFVDCDVLKACLACQVWPWCAYCHKFLFPCGSHRASRAHVKCIRWCRVSVDHTRAQVFSRLPAGF